MDLKNCDLPKIEKGMSEFFVSTYFSEKASYFFGIWSLAYVGNAPMVTPPMVTL